MDIDGKVETARLSVAAGGLMLYGITLNEWVAVATLIYLLTQTVVLLPKAVESVRVLIRKLRSLYK